MPKILAAGKGARIVNVSSAGHKRERIRFDDYSFEVRGDSSTISSEGMNRSLNRGQNGATYDKWKAYGQSKTANMLFSVALAEKLGPRGVFSYSLYPGRVRTNIAQSLTFEELRGAGE